MGVTVSNVKRLFRSYFGLDLSETALGYSRLSDLLQDPRFRDIGVVQARGAGQVVVSCCPDRYRYATPAPGRLWRASCNVGDASGPAMAPSAPQSCSKPQCFSTMPLQQYCTAPATLSLQTPLPGVHAMPGPLIGESSDSDAEYVLLSEGLTSGYDGACSPQATHLSLGGILPPPGLPLPPSCEVAALPQELGDQFPPSRSSADVLSGHLQRLLVLGREERQETLVKLADMMDGCSPSFQQTKDSPCRTRSNSASTSIGSDHTMGMDSEVAYPSQESLCVGMQDR